ncbi:MAG: hypothetical protein PUP90_18060 [Nostoc sp. S4]|nr:hypothetical protein [Nostoc sp. S4]
MSYVPLVIASILRSHQKYMSLKMRLLLYCAGDTPQESLRDRGFFRGEKPDFLAELTRSRIQTQEQIRQTHEAIRETNATVQELTSDLNRVLAINFDLKKR